MAKSVHEAVRQQAAQASQQTSARNAPVGRSAMGFKKTYSQDEWKHIEEERQAMRGRLLAEG